MRFTLFISFALAAIISFKVCAGMSERDDVDYDSRYMFRKARNALMSYRSVKKKTKELTLRLQKETVGDNTEFLVFLTPFVTQEFRFKMKEFHTTLFFNHRSHTAGARYIYEF